MPSPLVPIFACALAFPHSARAQTASKTKTSESKISESKNLELKSPLTAVGKWAVQFERVRIAHTDTTLEHSRARLVLVQQGDSVVGTWQRLEEGGATTAQPLDVNGVLKRDSLRIELTQIVDPDATFSNIAHEISEFMKEKIHGIVPMRTVLDLTVRGDSLVGTIRAVSRDGATMTPSGGVVATRVKP